MKQPINLFWFRRDLRLHDNAGLYQALRAGLPVLPLFIFDSEILNQLEDRDDKRVSFIYAAIESIQKELADQGSTIDARYGQPLKIFGQLLQEYSINTVFTNHDYEPYATKRDEAIKAFLEKNNIGFQTFKDQVIFEKNEVAKENGLPYSIYTPYYKRWAALLNKKDYQPFPSAELMQNYLRTLPKPLPTLESMGFVKNAGIPKLAAVDKEIIRHYHTTRNTPGIEGTTKMSVHLRFGTVSVRQLLREAIELNEVYVKELAWREFFMQMLWHQPWLVQQACKREYDNIQWRNNEEEFARWCTGTTGFPIVDAGMRELNATGLMHNRVRMVVASFLVKDLLIDWRWGEAYFARKLLDYELASNNGNWQWAAGCGCDAAPYFRVFNPTAQAEKFDKEKVYIKKWIPEFGTDDYPKPMLDHAFAKERCLAAYKKALADK